MFYLALDTHWSCQAAEIIWLDTVSFQYALYVVNMIKQEWVLLILVLQYTCSQNSKPVICLVLFLIMNCYQPRHSQLLAVWLLKKNLYQLINFTNQLKPQDRKKVSFIRNTWCLCFFQNWLATGKTYSSQNLNTKHIFKKLF